MNEVRLWWRWGWWRGRWWWWQWQPVACRKSRASAPLNVWKSSMSRSLSESRSDRRSVSTMAFQA